jgi:hypothetical protein
MFKLQVRQRQRETDMKTILSNQKGNIDHKDISIHEHTVPARQEKHATR